MQEEEEDRNKLPWRKVRRLGEGESVKSFDCGDPDLNDFIMNESLYYQQALLAVSYVMEEEGGQVLAYFSMANDRVSLTDFESSTEFNRFRRHRFVNEKRIKSYPAVKLCRFAVDMSARGQNLGSMLMDFMKRYFITNNKTGCRFITVDAYVDAIPFYLKNKFVPLNATDDNTHTRLLFFDLQDMKT